MPPKKTDLPQSVFARSKELLGLGAKMAFEELSHRVSAKVAASDSHALKKLQSQMDQAKLMIETMGRLKGAAMKVGQMLSMEAQDFLPPEVIDVLSKLQDQCECLSATEMKKILSQELGPDWESKIEDFSDVAIAAASIGQVHTARYRGQKIAIKIQYPGICESIESDLSILRRMTNTLLGLSNKRIDTTELFIELENVLRAEGEYLREGQHLEVFGRMLEGKSGYRVPRWIPELSTDRVLAMSFEDGLCIKKFLEENPTSDERNYFGALVLDLYAQEFFVAGMVQTDPNFANFLFCPRTRQLVVLDFGAVRHYPERFRRTYRELLRVIDTGDDVQIVRHSVGMGLVRAEESPECLAIYCQMLRKSIEPFAEHKQPFQFSDSEYAKEIRELTMDFTRQIRFSPPPHQLIFLHRKLSGIFSLLKKMDARVDLRPYWKSWVSES